MALNGLAAIQSHVRFLNAPLCPAVKPDSFRGFGPRKIRAFPSPEGVKIPRRLERRFCRQICFRRNHYLPRLERTGLNHSTDYRFGHHHPHIQPCCFSSPNCIILKRGLKNKEPADTRAHSPIKGKWEKKKSVFLRQAG